MSGTQAEPSPDTIRPILRTLDGGALEGAASTSRETANWQPRNRSPDMAINTVKPLADARGLDMIRNDGNARGAANAFKDGIVGAQYRLNSAPNWRVLQAAYGKGFDEKWAEEFQIAAESVFNLLGDSQSCWLDAERKKTFTGMIRLAVVGHFYQGEVLATAEWIREVDRPFNTAVQMISPTRLSNPKFASDDFYLRRGIKRDDRGRHLGYYIQTAYPGAYYPGGPDPMEWKYIPVQKPWGRVQVIHIAEQDEPDQTRGVAEMVAVLKQMRMTKNLSDISLQRAVVDASYAATIESELPNEAIVAAMGGQGGGFMDAYAAFMQGVGEYYQDANGITVDGVKMPHLFPGTTLKTQSLGTPGGVSTELGTSLLRHIASGLNLSYEEFTRDFSKTNYSSIQASMNRSALGMRSRKKNVADRFADSIYLLWLEEWINAGLAPMPRGFDKPGNGAFYAPMAKEALGACTWVGAAVGQVDQLKETQAALLRIAGGLSTYEDELARLGKDWREVFAQKAREAGMIETHGLVLSTDATKKNEQGTKGTLQNDNEDAAND